MGPAAAGAQAAVGSFLHGDVLAAVQQLAAPAGPITAGVWRHGRPPQVARPWIALQFKGSASALRRLACTWSAMRSMGGDARNVRRRQGCRGMSA